MALSIDLGRSLIAVLDEPALIVEDGRTAAANDAAKTLLGQHIEGSDVRFAIRHPEALRTIAPHLETRPLVKANKPLSC